MFRIANVAYNLTATGAWSEAHSRQESVAGRRPSEMNLNVSIVISNVAKIAILKEHFLSKSIVNFSETLMEDTKLMPDKVLKFSGRYPPPFLSCQTDPRRGRNCVQQCAVI